MTLRRALARRPAAMERMSLDGLAELVSMAYGGNQYLLDASLARGSMGAFPVRVREEPDAVRQVGAVFGVVQRRAELLCQAEFVWRRFRSGPRPKAGDVWTSPELDLLQPAEPLWIEMDAQVAVSGSAFVVRDRVGGLRVLPSRWCLVALGSQLDVDRPELAWDATPIGLIHHAPGGTADAWAWDEVAHVRPRPDPDAPWRGIAYLRPAVADAARLEASGGYVTQFFRQAATPNMVMTFPEGISAETIELTAKLFRQGHEGNSKAFRTAFIANGADLKVVGSQLKDLDFASVNSAAVSALCQASGVPLPLLGIQEGLEGAVTYANSRQYMRQFADLTGRQFWALGCRELGKLVRAPAGGELWVDTSRVSALLPERLDDAQALASEAQAIRTLVDGGWEPASAMAAVTAGDLTQLKHTGLVPVQLQPPGSAQLPGGGA